MKSVRYTLQLILLLDKFYKLQDLIIPKLRSHKT